MRIYQNYITGDDGDYDAYTANWIAQTFTPTLIHMISKVKLKLFRVGDPSTITVSIKATSSGKPTGADLCVGTIEGTGITESATGEWYEITLGDGYVFEKDVMYAIVVRAPDGDASNKVSWRADKSTPTYAGGTVATSSDSGTEWGTVSGSDMMFEEWGAGEASPTTTVWGNLFKSQISSEKIEEAIARIIQSHEDDANAHIETGESLQSHKASEIIDHAVISIINDKLKSGEISMDKFSMVQHQLYSVFESLDGWTKSPAGITAKIWGLLMQTGAVLNTVKELNAEPAGDGDALDYDKDPFFQTSVKLSSNEDQLVYIMSGSCNLDGTDNSFGFKILNSLPYAIHIKGDGESQTEYTTLYGTANPLNWNVYRAEFDTDAGEIRFYVNGTLVATHTENLPETNGPTLMTYYIKNTAELNKILYSKYLLFSKGI